MNETEKNKIGGVTASFLIIPLSIVLAILMVSVALLTKNVNRITGDMEYQMQRSSELQQAATRMQAGTSVLSETATIFVMTPVIPGGPEAGSLNEGPLQGYAEELAVDRRPGKIGEYLRSCGLSEELQGYIDTAATGSVQMQELQTRAISLVLSVYPLPDDPVYSTIKCIELTAEEQAMPAEARIAKARNLLFDKSYSLLKSGVSKSIDNFHADVQKQLDDASEEGRKRIDGLRNVVWVFITLIFAVLALAFLTFYLWIVKPMRQYAKDIVYSGPLKQRGPIKELHTMVSAYNEVLERRNRLETILRTAAETDALTGLQNRYHLEQSILFFNPADGALAVLQFDVNFLKTVNDTKGHQAGDQLLRRTADAIREYFGAEEKGANCYRTGGDEFAAVLRGCTEDDIRSRIESFRQALEREGISVSVGYAFSETADRDCFRQLMKTADERMYENKQQIHKLYKETIPGKE